VITPLDVRLAVGDLLGGDPRRREELHQISTGQSLDRSGVGDLVNASARGNSVAMRSIRRIMGYLQFVVTTVALFRGAGFPRPREVVNDL